jgi:hypothetical protein
LLPLNCCNSLNTAIHSQMKSKKVDVSSIKIKCPHCDSNSYSLVEYRNSPIAFVVSIIMILFLGMLGLMMFPFVTATMRISVHRCSKCLNEIKQTSIFNLDGLEDKVISFSLGKFGIILSRKYLIYITIFVFSCIMLYFAVSSANLGHDHDSRPISTLKWDDFMKDCGPDAFKNNVRQTIRTFERKYSDRGIQWDGYVVRVNYLEDLVNRHFHETSILIKMVPA